MIFSLNVYTSPISRSSSQTAYRFAQQLTAQHHQLYRVFFYHDGVYHGNQNRVATDVNKHSDIIAQQWHDLAQAYQVDLVLCVQSALKRGILDKTQAERYQAKGAANLHDGFELSGLGQMIDAITVSDRIITFG